MYLKIITHNDFDGLASAAICSHIFQIEKIEFAGPNTIINAQISVGEDDIVCDLPYPLTCGLWFDHHEGNIDELKYRKIEPDSIPGLFQLQPSCARVCFNYFSAKQELPDHFTDLVAEADIIDAFDFKTVEEWRRETPGKIVDAAIKARGNIELSEKRYLMREWIKLLREKPLAEVALDPSIQEMYAVYQQQEEETLALIKKNAAFLPEDKQREVVVLDFTSFNRRPTIIKNLAYLLFPEALAVLEVNSLFRRGRKTNDFGVSMALGLNLNLVEHQRNIGEIMRELNIGDGHAGAAGGTVYCHSKNEMLKEKQQILQEMIRLWQQQG